MQGNRKIYCGVNHIMKFMINEQFVMVDWMYVYLLLLE